MEMISLKMDENLLEEIDESLPVHRYSTRTEFIRDAIRRRLSDLEKEDAIKKLSSFKGSLKSKKSDEATGKIAMQNLAKKLDVSLD